LFYRRYDHGELLGRRRWHAYVAGWRKRVNGQIEKRIFVVEGEGRVRELSEFGGVYYELEWNKDEQV